MQSLRAAARGDGQVAIITGAPGLGKTRLACWQDGDAPPLWPWQAILRALGVPEHMLVERLGETPHDRFARFVAVLDHLRALSREAPIVAVLDDAHMAYPATLLLARFLARERRGLGLLLVLTRRDEIEKVEVRDLLAELEGDATWIGLQGLAEPAVRAYLVGCGIRAVTPEVIEAVGAITRGNPLHLRSVATRSAFGGNLLAGLERATEDLLARLSATHRRLVAVGAVLGLGITVDEVARVADALPVQVTEALSRARALGLVEGMPPGPIAFVHHLVRESVLAALPPDDCLEAQARAAAAFVGSDPERMLRRAHHALAAAPRSEADAVAAVRIVQETAAALVAADGFEAAAALLAPAVELHATITTPAIPAAPLVVQWAETVLACGRLTEARPLFQRAATLAEADDDVWSLARAALGLGGVWLRDHRLTDETVRVQTLQQRALAALPPEADVLRVRLIVRLAAENAYRGGSIDPLLRAVDDARRTGDPRALAEALSLCHHALLSPEHNGRRLEIAEELIAAAVAARDGLLTLIGLCRRTADLFVLADARARAALEELRVRADALQCRSVLYIVRAMEVMLGIRAGRLAEAEAAAAACLAFGLEVGDPDALAYHGVQLTAIRVFQGREAELADVAASIAASPTLVHERERGFALAATLLALRAGRPDGAHAALEQLRCESVGSLPLSSSWLASMLVVAELAAALDDADIARAAYDALLPFAEVPIIVSLAVVCFGSVHRVLGLAALTCRDHDRAVDHLASAVTANERLGHRPAAIQARAELGLARIRRGGDGDVLRGRALVEEAIAAGEAAGMNALAARWRAALAASSARRRTESLATMTPAARSGYWHVAVGDERATVADRVGVRYLAVLVASPDRLIAALALVADHRDDVPAAGTQRVLDQPALDALRVRIKHLRQQLVLSTAEEEELEALARELARVLGLGGRSRAFADAPEHARTAVRKAIKRAIEQISAANPAVGRHLVARVSTGTLCCYRAAD